MDKDLLDLYNAREGTSQQTRLDENLVPESFQIDGRTGIELVNFAIEFSKSLVYYNTDKSIKSGWENFFIKDRYVFLYVIAYTNLNQIQKSFYNAYEFAYNLTDEKDRLAQWPSLTGPIVEMLNILDSWKENLGITDLGGDDLIKFPKVEISDDYSKGRDEIKQKKDLEKIKSTFEKIYSALVEIIKQAEDRIQEENASGQNVRPHMALFIGFLKIYEILQHRINGITKKHLDYYYEEVLKLTRKGKTSDETYVRFILNEKYDSYFLEKGISVTGSKDNSGEPIVYQTIHDVDLTSTKIKGLYTLFVSQNKLNYSGGINHTQREDPHDKVTDIFFKKHDPENIGSMKIFGEDQFFKASSERTMDTAQIGFIIASPHFALAEGQRKICLDFIGTEKSYVSFRGLISLVSKNKNGDQCDYSFTFNQIFRTAFDVFIVLNGVETKFDKFNIQDNPEMKGITLELILAEDELPVTALKTNDFKNQPDLNIPYVKVLLREESHIYAFPLVYKLDIINIKLRLYIKGIKNFLLFNNYGQIDHANPFQLFGAIPKINSYFLLGSKELFSKPLVNFDLDLHWYQLPTDPEGWSGYFTDYEEEPLNSDYKVKVEYLNSGVWKKLKSKSIFSLFKEDDETQQNPNSLSSQTQFKNLKLPVNSSESKDGENFKPYTLKTKSGYIKLELISPEFAFGYDAYQKNLFQSITYNAKLAKGEIPKQPNPPFSPIIKSISINYTAKTDALGEKGSGEAIQLFSLGPVGFKKRGLKSPEKPVKLLLDFEPEGHLMIGLDKYPRNGMINFFFNPDLSTLAPDDLEVSEPKWQFLENNNWNDIPKDALEIDNTRNFLQSGIISIKIPESITNNNTLINDKLFWIKASISKHSYIVPEYVGIHTNVQRVKWDEKSDGSHLKEQVPEYSITRMYKFDPKIVRVEQLLEPFNGKFNETKSDFYVRISERLRHKNRASTNWDYERLLLERYPMIYKAKCFNAIDENGSQKAGCLTIAVTPDIRSPLVSNQLEPKFGIKYLMDMRDELKKISSRFAEIKVINPHYEKIRVICKVKFTGKLNPNNYISRLNKDLIEHLTPWIYSATLDEQFGNSQYRSKIMSFVNQRNYVEFVTAFSIVKTNTDQGKFSLFDTVVKKEKGAEYLLGNDTESVSEDYSSGLRKVNDEVIQPHFPWSILTSVEQHDITAIDNINYQKPVRRKIGNMKLGVDFGIKMQKREEY